MSITGLVAPPPTPMDDSGDRLHLDGVRPLVEHLVEGGVHGIFANGTTGEGAMLTLDEREAAAGAFVEAAAGRVPVIVQVGAPSTRDTVRLARHAQDVNADAVAVVAPYYFAHDQAALKRHVARVAEAVELPVYAYDIPSRTQNGYALDTLRELHADGAIVGAKDSSGDLPRMLEMLDVADFQLLPGSDVHAGTTLQAGAAGMVSGPGTVVPQPYVALWAAVREGDAAATSRWQAAIVAITRTLRFGGDIPLLKGALGRLVPGMGGPRAPHVAPDAEVLDRVIGDLADTCRDHGLPEVERRLRSAARGVVGG